MKSLVDLLAQLLSEIGSRCAAPFSRDVLTLRARVKHEGDSFITITLPDFCKCFEQALAEGRIAPTSFEHFKRLKGRETPAFLSGFLCKVFGPDGYLLDNASVDCIRAVRQICLFGKKVQRPCSQARNAAAVEAYCETDCQVAEVLPASQFVRYFGKVADIIVGDLNLGIALEDLLLELQPRHGPGATREGVSRNGKWNWRSWTVRLEKLGFTYLRFGRGSIVMTDDELRPEKYPLLLMPEDEQPARVVLVPKTLKTPRVIAVEPVSMQYAQQALSKLLTDRIAHCELTRGRVNFRDQSVNQFHAWIGSRSGSLATIDMSEASDRVSLAAVQRAFQCAPNFLALMEGSRSSHAELPSGEVISLSKFASMGSALCFPVESLIFYIAIIASRIYRVGGFPTARMVRTYARNVYVYGDDLIVPSDVAASVCADLESLGLKVNARKSFWTGRFRESCGKDYYDGEDVSPTYLRRDLPTSRSDASGILSAVATYHQLIAKGYVRTAAQLRNCVEKLVGKLPQVPVESPAIGWHDFSEIEPIRRWNRNLQRSEILALVPVTSKVADPLEGDAALAKCLHSTIGLPEVDVEHLSTSPRAYALALKRRWVPAR